MVFKPNTNNELYEAVDIWCSNKKKALNIYGEINTWNTINITSMEELFRDKQNFNDNISNWNTSKVTNMNYMFYKLDLYLFLIIIISIELIMTQG